MQKTWPSVSGKLVFHSPKGQPATSPHTGSPCTDSVPQAPRCSPQLWVWSQSSGSPESQLQSEDGVVNTGGAEGQWCTRRTYLRREKTGLSHAGSHEEGDEGRISEDCGSDVLRIRLCWGRISFSLPANGADSSHSQARRGKRQGWGIERICLTSFPRFCLKTVPVKDD